MNDDAVKGTFMLKGELGDKYERAVESRGQEVIEVYDQDDGAAFVAYAFIGHVTMRPEWVYSHGGEGHVCSPDPVVSALKTFSEDEEGIGVRLVKKELSVFAEPEREENPGLYADCTQCEYGVLSRTDDGERAACDTCSAYVDPEEVGL